MSVFSSRSQFGLFILLRRLRYPLAVVVLVYAVAVLGFTFLGEGLRRTFDPRGVAE